MKLMRCPINGLRPIQEFTYGGPYRPMPAPMEVSDIEWADYVFNRSGEAGIKWEWWYHLASGTWFLARRDTFRDEIIHTCLFEEMAHDQ
jgi:sarcosine oxidase subunit delta